MSYIVIQTRSKMIKVGLLQAMFNKNEQVTILETIRTSSMEAAWRSSVLCFLFWMVGALSRISNVCQSYHPKSIQGKNKRKEFFLSGALKSCDCAQRETWILCTSSWNQSVMSYNNGSKFNYPRLKKCSWGLDSWPLLPLLSSVVWLNLLFGDGSLHLI